MDRGDGRIRSHQSRLCHPCAYRIAAREGSALDVYAPTVLAGTFRIPGNVGKPRTALHAGGLSSYCCADGHCIHAQAMLPKPESHLPNLISLFRKWNYPHFLKVDPYDSQNRLNSACQSGFRSAEYRANTSSLEQRVQLNQSHLKRGASPCVLSA